ncbi:hypothetical protein V2J09_009042 [Rumex salicifolius]
MDILVIAILGEPNDGEGIIEISPEFLITNFDESNPIPAIVDATYPNLLQSLSGHEYFRERVISAPTHDVVDEINGYMMSLIPEEENEYYSMIIIIKNETFKLQSCLEVKGWYFSYVNEKY